jgi:hypothetical protein
MHGPVVEAALFGAIRFTGRAGDSRFIDQIPRHLHGRGSERDGSVVVQPDTRTRQKKVIACLRPFFQDRYGATLVGTFSSAVDPAGDTLRHLEREQGRTRPGLLRAARDPHPRSGTAAGGPTTLNRSWSLLGLARPWWSSAPAAMPGWQPRPVG